MAQVNPETETPRIRMLLYGVPKIGKTRCVLSLAERGEVVYLVSADRGYVDYVRHKDKYKTCAVYAPDGLRGLRKDFDEIRKRVEKVLQKRPADHVWVVLDTATHMQQNLLVEARKVELSTNQGSKSQGKVTDEFVRDATTRVDYLVNLGHMAEMADYLLNMPCNVVIIALEREEKDDHNKISRRPQLGGQSLDRFAGDADVIARMCIEKGVRTFHCKPLGAEMAGDRFDVLDQIELADLAAIRDKVFPREAAPALVANTTPERADTAA